MPHVEYLYRHVSRCTHCGTVEGRYRSYDPFLFGTPKRVCPSCGKIFFDGFFLEKALNYWVRSRPFPYFPICAAFTFAFLLCDWNHLIANPPATPLQVIVYGGGTILCLILLPFSWRRWIRENSKPDFSPEELEGRMMASPGNYDLVESARRLADPEYLFFLMDNGVEVPDYYFERMDTPPDWEQVRRHREELERKERMKNLAVSRETYQNELEYYEYCLSLGPADPAFRQMASQRGMAPQAFEAYCRRGAEAAREKLAELEAIEE